MFLEPGLWVHQLCDLSCHFAVSSSETQALLGCRREMDPGYQGEGFVRIQWEMGQPQTQTQQWRFQTGDGLLENWDDTSWTFRMPPEHSGCFLLAFFSSFHAQRKTPVESVTVQFRTSLLERELVLPRQVASPYQQSPISLSDTDPWARQQRPD